MAEKISLREFARRRGVALSAVQKAIADGRVTAIERDGKRLVGIDYELGTEQWNKHTDPIQAARSGSTLAESVQASGQPAAQPEPAKPDEPAAGPVAGDKDPHGFYQARADRERSQAALAELELLEQLGKLVSVDEMQQIAQRRYRTLRDQVLNVPDRVSAILAAERDPAQVHALLTKELKRVLHELSDDARAEIARGVAERVAA